MSLGNDAHESKLWPLYRVVMFLAAASLAVYLPYKYATQLHTINGLYAFLLPLSGVLAIAGMLFAVRPGLVFRLPLPVRGFVGAVAVGWIATGMMCVPMLSEKLLNSPIDGLFRTFHMTVQHVVLSIQVTVLAILPRTVLGSPFVAGDEEAVAQPAEGRP